MTTTDIDTTDLLARLQTTKQRGLQAVRIEVDNALYALYRERLTLLHKQDRALLSLRHAVGDKERYVGRYREWTFTYTEVFDKARDLAEADGYAATRAREALAAHAAVGAELRDNQERTQPFTTAYAARPWTRAFLVTDGHVHSSMGCSTCFPTTEFTWLTQFSDHSEAEIVEAAGERACTVCYPTAPTLRSFEKTSTLFTEEEAERNHQREQRAAEKAERQAKKIEKALTPDGSEFVVRGADFHESFKTERAATIWAVDQLAMAQSNYYSRIVTPEHITAVEAIVRAVADKHNRLYDEVKTEFNKKARAKARKEYS